MVDVDDQATWPRSVRERVGAWAAALRGSSAYTGDLSRVQLIEAEAEFRELLRGDKLRVFHCTRLLPHEVARIRNEGLRPLDLALIPSRIAAAHQHGFLTDAERESLERRHLLAIGYDGEREHKVCLVLGRRIFDHDPWGCEPLLSNWGGEAIYFGRDEDENVAFRTLGRPSLVELAIPAVTDGRATHFFPALTQVFVGAALGLEDACGEIHHYARIPADDVLGVWQPGDCQYDQHARLPRG